MRPLLIAAALACVAAPALAASYRLGPLQAIDPWSRPATAGANGVGFMTLKNTGKQAQTLVAVRSPAARKVEIHRSSMAGGVMSMEKVDAVPAPAGGTATLAPGGYHVMFIGLAKAQKAGDQIPATLVFGDGKTLAVSFAVGDGLGPPGAKPAAAASGMAGMNHGH